MAGGINPIQPQTLQQLSKPAINPMDIIKSYYQGASLKEDQEDRQIKRELNDKQMELADLNIEQKRMKGVGSAAIGMLEMSRNTDNEMNFLEQYRTYRENAPEGVKEQLPEQFQTKAEAENWARQAAAQSDKLLPYLKVTADKSNQKQWQFTNNILAVPPEDRSRAQNEYMKLQQKQPINIYTAPTKAKLQDTMMSLGTISIPGTDQNLMDSLDTGSRASFASAVTNMADLTVSQSARTQNPIDRATAVNMAVQALSSRIVKVDTLKEKIPFIGDAFDKDYAFISPDKEKELRNKQPEKAPASTPSELGEGEVMEYQGYMYRMNNGSLQKKKLN